MQWISVGFLYFRGGEASTFPQRGVGGASTRHVVSKARRVENLCSVGRRRRRRTDCGRAEADARADDAPSAPALRVASAFTHSSSLQAHASHASFCIRGKGHPSMHPSMEASGAGAGVREGARASSKRACGTVRGKCILA